MRARTGALAFAALAALCAPATPARADASAARHVCANGLEVVVAESHGRSLVTMELSVRAGAMIEDEAHSGLSHLYEHLFFDGNAGVPDQTAYEARARALGVKSSAMTENERIAFFFTTSAPHVADAMALMRDSATAPSFDPHEVDRERTMVADEIDRNESEPSHFLWQAVTSHAFWRHPTQKAPLGRRATVLAATPDAMRAMQKRYFVPNNALLVVTGDVRADEVFRLAESEWGSWARADDPFAAAPVAEQAPIRTSEVVLVPQAVEDFQAVAMWQGPSAGGAELGDTYALDLVTAAADEPTSRFQRALVDSGRCAGVTLSYATERHTGPITVAIGARAEQAATCVSAVFAELRELYRPEYFSDDELASAARRILLDRAESRETTLGLAHALSAAWAVASLEYDATYEERLRSVSRADVAHALGRWMLGRPFVLGAMASQAQIDAGLSRARLESLAGVGR